MTSNVDEDVRGIMLELTDKNVREMVEMIDKDRAQEEYADFIHGL